MDAKLDRDVIESFIYCEYKAHLKLVGERGIQSDYESMLAQSREHVAAQATDTILSSHEATEVERHVALTAQVLARGVPMLLDAVLDTDLVCLRFDGLAKAAPASPSDACEYQPVLFHDARNVRKQQRLLLDLYGLLLAELQGPRPNRGTIYYGRQCKPTTIGMFSDLRRARRLLEQLKELQRGDVTPKLILNDHCDICEFRDRCHQKALEQDNISLLRGMREKEVRAKVSKGILTVTQFAHTFRPRRKGKRTNQSQRRHHALQAMAIRDKKVYVFGTREIPRRPVLIYLDIEGLPDEGHVYLIGMIVSDGATETRHSFWANCEEEEFKIFEEFLSVVARYDDFLLFCYGSYEKAFLKRMRKKARRKKPVDRLLDALRNTLSLVHSHVYFPCYSNGLKDIGALLGCAWSDEDASGLQSIVWRTNWEATHDDRWKAKLISYNEEDCLALKAVTQYVSAVLADGGPGGPPASAEGPCADVARVEEVDRLASARKWGKVKFFHSAYEYVNDRAYFDYQRQRVYVRTSNTLRKNAPSPRLHRNRKLRASKHVQITSRKCPACGSSDLTRDVTEPPRGVPKPRYKRAFDLVITPNGIKRKVIECRSSVRQCRECAK